MLKVNKVVIPVILSLTITLFVYFHYKKKCKKIDAENNAKRQAIRNYYDRNKENSVQLLGKALEGRKEANSVVSNFLAEESSEQIVL